MTVHEKLDYLMENGGGSNRDSSSILATIEKTNYATFSTTYTPNYSGKMMVHFIGYGAGGYLNHKNLTLTGLSNLVELNDDYSFAGNTINSRIYFGDTTSNTPITISGVTTYNGSVTTEWNNRFYNQTRFYQY